MGFCTPAETVRFLRDTVMFEEMLINGGLRLFKFWFSVSREEQLRRVMSRARDGLKQCGKSATLTSGRCLCGTST